MRLSAFWHDKEELYTKKLNASATRFQLVVFQTLEGGVGSRSGAGNEGVPSGGWNGVGEIVVVLGGLGGGCLATLTLSCNKQESYAKIGSISKKPFRLGCLSVP